jgi:hypothetical protein
MTKSRTLHPTAAAARIAPLLMTLAGMAIAAGGIWLWRHRQQIAAALVAAVATTYSAGAWGRQHVEALATDAARRLPAQPIAALAPITAILAAAWGLVDRATMARGHRAQRTQLANIDDLVSVIIKAIDANNAYLKRRPNIITLSKQDFGIDNDNIKYQSWLRWLRDHNWTVVQ